MSVVLIALVGITVYDVIRRYVFQHPIIWGKDMEIYTYGALMLLCAAYVLQRGGHVRIALIVERYLPPRGQEAMSLFWYVVFFLPFTVVLLIYGWDLFIKSWEIKEVAFTAFHPPMYPLKFCIPLAAFMLLLQGIAEMTRHCIRIIKGQGYEL